MVPSLVRGPRIIARRTAIEPVISERVSARRNFRSESLTAPSDNRLTAEHEDPSDSPIANFSCLPGIAVPLRDTQRRNLPVAQETAISATRRKFQLSKYFLTSDNQFLLFRPFARFQPRRSLAPRRPPRRSRASSRRLAESGDLNIPLTTSASRKKTRDRTGRRNFAPARRQFPSLLAIGPIYARADSPLANYATLRARTSSRHA